MRREDVQAFLDRPWEKLRELKDRHVAERIARLGPDEALRLGEALRESGEAMGGRPTEADRAEDLASHLRVRRLLDRASSPARRDSPRKPRSRTR